MESYSHADSRINPESGTEVRCPKCGRVPTLVKRLIPKLFACEQCHASLEVILRCGTPEPASEAAPAFSHGYDTTQSDIKINDNFLIYSNSIRCSLCRKVFTYSNINGFPVWGDLDSIVRWKCSDCKNINLEDDIRNLWVERDQLRADVLRLENLLQQIKELAELRATENAALREIARLVQT